MSLFMTADELNSESSQILTFLLKGKFIWITYFSNLWNLIIQIVWDLIAFFFYMCCLDFHSYIMNWISIILLKTFQNDILKEKKNPTETIFLGRGKWRQKSQQCLNTTAVGRKTCAVVIIHDLSTSIYSTVYSMYMCVSVCPYISFPYSPSRDYIVLCHRQIELNQELNNCQTVLLYHCCGRMKQH